MRDAAGIALRQHEQRHGFRVRLRDAAVSVLGAGSVLQAHSMEDGEFKSDRIHLARHVVLAPAAFVHYGTHLGAAAELEPDSFLMKGEAVPAGATWTGNPAASCCGAAADV